MGQAIRSTMAGMFCGRDSELAELWRAFRATAAGTGQVVVVTGPAGIGKSGLCAEASRSYAEAGALVLTGGCPPECGADIAYAPFITAWQGAGGAGFDGLFAGLAALGPLAVAVARAWLTDRLLHQLQAWSVSRPVVRMNLRGKALARSAATLMRSLDSLRAPRRG
jgi:predicted ATPase